MIISPSYCESFSLSLFSFLDPKRFIYQSKSIYPFILYSNGNLITNPGEGYNGSDISVSSFATAGYTINKNVYLLDNFTVPYGGWNIFSFEFFIYQSAGSEITTPIVDATFQLFAGNLSFYQDAISIYGDNITNVCCLSHSFTGIYRISKGSSFDDIKRKIYSLEINMQDLFLDSGSYFFKISLSSTSGVIFYPHLSKSGNAIQFTSKTYLNLHTELPFYIHGPMTSSPSNFPTFQPTPTLHPTRKPTYSGNQQYFRQTKSPSSSSSSSSSSTSSWISSIDFHSTLNYWLLGIFCIICICWCDYL